jgi:hypothetical protein
MWNRRNPFVWGWIAIALYVFPMVSLASEPDRFATAEKSIQVIAVGDVMVGSYWPNGGELPANGGRDLMRNVAKDIHGGDLMIANVEGVIGSGLLPRQPIGDHSYRFLMPSGAARVIAEAGFNVGTMANNHSMDGGCEGGAATVMALEASGVIPCGIPMRPVGVVKCANGISASVLPFAPHMGTNGFDIPVMVRMVQAEKAKGHVVIVTMHAGAEGVAARRIPDGIEHFLGANRGNVRAFAHAAVDAGADLVIGHGPHVLRGMEMRRGRLIAYSLGNFCTYGRFGLSGKNGIAVILKVHIGANGRFLEGRLVPTIQDKASDGWKKGVAVQVDKSNSGIDEVIALSGLDFPSTKPMIARDGSITAPNRLCRGACDNLRIAIPIAVKGVGCPRLWSTR